MDKTRMKDGFFQILFEGNKHWKFIIGGFSDNDCRVLREDKTWEDCPIDSKNRVTINGKKYSDLHWYH